MQRCKFLRILILGTKAAVLILDPWTPKGSVDRFQGFRELGWEKNYNFIFNNISLKFIFSFCNERRQQSNSWLRDSKNVC